MAKRGRPIEAVCGTPSAYRRHYRLNEEVCGPCRKAHGEYLRARKAPTTSTRLIDALSVSDGWMNIDLAADVLDVEEGAIRKSAYRLRSRGVVEMRVVDHGHGAKSTEVRLTEEGGDPSRAWITAAACAGSMTDFFPGEREYVLIRDAKAVCEPCKVRSECLAYAIATQAEGIWGGTTDLERRRMLGAA